MQLCADIAPTYVASATAINDRNGGGSIGERNTLIFSWRWSVGHEATTSHAARRAEIWDRWRAGESMKSIGRGWRQPLVWRQVQRRGSAAAQFVASMSVGRRS